MCQVTEIFDLTIGLKPAVQVGHSFIEYTVYPNSVLAVDTLKTPAKFRGAGSARRTMQALLAATDRAGFVVVLTPEPIHGEARLIDLIRFYRSLGFVPMAASPVRQRHPEQDHYKMARLPVMAVAA